MGATHYEGVLIVFLVASAASCVTLRLTSTKNKETSDAID
jgi:hypothetical protein